MRRGETRGDQDADELAEWLRDGYDTAYRTAYGVLRNRTDAEDAVQEAFLRAWRFRAAVPSREGVQPWLYRVVVNACLSKLRRDRRYRATVVSMGEGPPKSVGAVRSGTAHPESDPEARAMDRATRDLILEALADLPEHLRVVVVLRYYGGLSEREIATVIHRRAGTVKSRMHEARSRLGADARLARLQDDVDEGQANIRSERMGR
ncbi:MAG: sigma-70 family RNA polymerase sigma factor [Actinomycetota bacterium]|nr:sigma-70 family RNA polymerase sigma factor [Actinomycetota bacterium]